MPKSPDAFRTISEVADWLGVQAHVLRFWESKFSQVKPIKRAGGRRYYRPTDMLLLGGIKQMLHEDGMTIKGVQKILREKGVSFVSDQSPPLDDLTIAVIEGKADEVELAEVADSEPEAIDETVNSAPEDETAQPASVESASPEQIGAVTDPQPASEEMRSEEEAITEDNGNTSLNDPAEGDAEQVDSAFVSPEDTPEISQEPEAASEDTTADGTAAPDVEEPELLAEDIADESQPEATSDGMPTFRAHARGEENPAPEDAPKAEPDDANEEPARATPFAVTPPEPKEEAAKKPRNIDVGPLPELADFQSQPSALTAIASLSQLTDAQAEEIRPLLARLTRLRASMANPRKDIAKD